MEETDKEMMLEAIALAERCKPVAHRIPKVGAVISIGNAKIGEGHRGSGEPDDDDHAEKIALQRVVDRKQLPRATVYTTLEPCTPEVRSDPLNCCTELIRHGEVKRVFIGILDPNQGVRGKGLWELQSRGIEVELFPPELAKRIRVLNDAFIKEQQTLGIRITNLVADQTIRTYDKEGTYKLEGTFLNAPRDDVFAFVNRGGLWWPQSNSLRINDNRTWSVMVHFGAYGAHTLSIVRVNELGAGLVKYYRKIAALNQERLNIVMNGPNERRAQDLELFAKISGERYPGIEMARLPKGLELQDQVDIFVEDPPKG